ncbi:DUF1659 domain-containing protein [Bhargavaea massiliensis]|uniref:DUF1659 domain-containing protein n=1 Tax=Bhargavaea massiliensis TaxID=2697500 RepID=UPI001BCAB1FB|nr:DUF1659 domain-containing protein [Bhargavaea massiliensis]
MANIVFKNASIRLHFDAGFDGEGKPVVKLKTYRNVSGSADAESLAAAVGALGSLSGYPYIAAEKVETAEITQY